MTGTLGATGHGFQCEKTFLCLTFEPLVNFDLDLTQEEVISWAPRNVLESITFLGQRN